MNDIAIRVENLGKRYRIGAKQERYNRFSEQVTDWLAAPLHRLKRLGRPAPEQETIWALRDVSFEVKRGEAVGIIGRNGAGKSTLLKILSRITEPTTGQAELRGRVSSLLEVGTGFHPELTGRENIYLNGTILGMRRREIDKKFDEIVAFSGVEPFIDTPVKRYSSGMQVRLAFAVAAHLESEILLVDEVLAVGDAEFQKQCLGKMGEVVLGGRTVLFVSHNMAAVKALCARGFLLEGGKVVAREQVTKIVDRYLSSDSRAGKSETELPGIEDGCPISHGMLTIAGPDGKPGWQFPIGESWRLKLRFAIREHIPGVIAAIGMHTAEGTPITSMYSEERDLVPGEYEVQFIIDYPLKACLLQLGVGISSRRQSIYYMLNIARVEILPVFAGESRARMVQGGGILLGAEGIELRAVHVDLACV